MASDQTPYYLLTKEHVSVANFEGKEILKVSSEGLTLLAQAAFRDVQFLLRPEHQEQVAQILTDPEASDNDKFVALTFLRNAEVSAKGILPYCQDTGTAIIMGKKGQRVWTDGNDEEALSRGVYNTYVNENLRYSQIRSTCTTSEHVQTCPRRLISRRRMRLLPLYRQGGSANKTYLYQETALSLR